MIGVVARYALSPVKRQRTNISPIRAAVLAFSLIALASTVSACDQGTAWVAKVDGVAVDAPNFAQGASKFATVNGSTSVPDPRGIVPTSDAAQYALFLVQVQAIQNLNAKHESKVTDADLSDMRKQLLASQQAAALRKLPAWMLDQLVAAQAGYQALTHFYGARVDGTARAKAYYEANKAQFQQICLDVIAATQEAPLDAAKAELTGGKSSFATVAKAVAGQQPAAADGTPSVALGEKADGNVGCIPVTNLSNLFASPDQLTNLTGAKPNSLVGPLPVAGGGYMLFRVRKTTVQSFAQAQPSIEQALGPAGTNEAQQALNTYLTKADIRLNPRIGTWTTGVGYTPPQGAIQPKPAKVQPKAQVLSSGGR